MSSSARKRYLSFELRRRISPAYAVVHLALLSVVAMPPVHAQEDPWALDGTGTVRVSTPTLTIREGESATYTVTLTAPPTGSAVDDPWFIWIEVDGQTRTDGLYSPDGDYDKVDSNRIRWSPGGYWTFYGNQVGDGDWQEEKGITIYAEQDDDDRDATIKFTHHVWDHDNNCPEHLSRVGEVVVTILDDERHPPVAPEIIDGGNNVNVVLPTLSIDDVEVNEDDGNAVFRVTLEGSSEEDVTVGYATSDGSAKAGRDYMSTNGTLTFTEGIMQETISVRVEDDSVVELAESFVVTLSAPTNARISKGLGTGTIIDDEPDVPTVKFSAASYRVTEGSEVPVTVVLSQAPGADLTIPLTHEPAGDTLTTDYSGIPPSVTFGELETSQTFMVHATEDDEDDDGEQVILGFGALPSGWALADPEVATITINEHRPADEKDNWTRRAVSGWLRQFGDTAALHVLEALDERIRCAPIRGSVPGRAESSRSRRGCEPRDREPMSLVVAGHRLPIVPAPAEASGLSNPADGPADAWASDGWPLDIRGTGASRSLTAREVLAASAFHFSPRARTDTAQDDGQRFSFWGRGSLSAFDDDEYGGTWDGDVASATFGVDYADRWFLAGFAISHSEGDGSFSLDGLGGTVDSTLTSLYPYVYVRMDERVSVWTAVGFGSGSVKLRMNDLESRTDISTRMGAVGVRRELLYPAENWGVSAALKADALLSGITSDASRGLAGTRATTNRQRLAVEVAQEFTLVSGAWVAPFTEIGARHDGGTGAGEVGLEISSGFRYEYPLVGWTAEFRARGLFEDAITEFDELGVSGSLRYDPIANSALGPNFALSIAGGLEGWLDPEALWGYQTTDDRGTDDGGTPDTRIDAEFGYAFPVLGRSGTRTPWVGASLSERWRDLRLGYRLGFGSAMRLVVEGALRQSTAGDESSDYSIMLRLSVG